MLQFKLSDTAAVMILTLSENVSLTGAYYLFVFTHVLTKQQVKFLLSADDEQSDYTARYNQFTIDPSVVFASRPPGSWNYVVYEQESDTNTDPALTGAVLEYGKLILNRAIDFEFTMYNQPTTYSVYNG